MKLGFIGIGLMGKPMTLRLLAAGHEVTVWNRSAEKLTEVLAKGARRADSPAAVARALELYRALDPAREPTVMVEMRKPG